MLYPPYLKYVALLLLLCSGCVAISTQEITTARNTPLPNDAFKERLRTGYLDLYDSERKQGDRLDASRYGHKAFTLVEAEDYIPPVDDLTERRLPADKLNMLASERNFLVSAFAQGIYREHPELSAKAQLSFDCWVEQEEEGFQKDDILNCKHDFLDNKQEIAALLEEKTRQRHEEKKRHEAEQARLKAQGQHELAARLAAERQKLRKMPAPYIVFFGFNSTILDLSGQKTMEKIAREVSVFNPYKIVISGHTDLVGSAEYNMVLGRKRAREIASVLAAYGIDQNLLDIRAYGENRPNIPTKDGKAEPQNRYGRIYFLKDNRVYY